MESKLSSRIKSAPSKFEATSKVFKVKCCVFKAKSSLVYDSFSWVQVADFIRIEKASILKYFPNGFSTEGEITFIGKARTLLKSSNKITDQLGAFKRSSRKLEIVLANKIFNIDTFTLMNFSQSKNFYWHPVTEMSEKMPANCLKIGVDTLNQKILYSGRTSYNKNVNIIGHVTGSGTGDGQNLVVADLNQLNGFKRFEILCLRPSPASLKCLVRLKIRKIMKNENLLIEKLKYLVPDNLIKYIKYSNELKVNHQLNQGDCLISPNGIYKLSIESNGRLVFYINENRDYLFLYDNVQSLWFSDLRLMVCFKDFTSNSFLDNLDNINIVLDNSKLKLTDDGQLHIISPHHKKNIVFQFREDLFTFWNLNTPKFDFIYYFENKVEKIIKKNGVESSSDSSSNSDSSSSSDDSDDSSDESLED